VKTWALDRLDALLVVALCWSVSRALRVVLFIDAHRAKRRNVSDCFEPSMHCDRQNRAKTSRI